MAGQLDRDEWLHLCALPDGEAIWNMAQGPFLSLEAKGYISGVRAGRPRLTPQGELATAPDAGLLHCDAGFEAPHGFAFAIVSDVRRASWQRHLRQQEFDFDIIDTIASHARRVGVLQFITVNPLQRGSGLGRRYVGRVLADFDKHGADVALIEAMPEAPIDLVAFYETFGFEACGEHADRTFMIRGPQALISEVRMIMCPEREVEFA